jgi:LPS-assembly protein
MVRRAALAWAKLTVLLASLMLLPTGLLAQKATLIADSVEISSKDVLIATGMVEVFFGTVRVTASRVIYDRSLNRLVIEGPINLDDGTSVRILASSAELDDDLRNGLITSASVIIDQQLQITASTLQRVDGRYNAMQHVAASSCQSCKGGAPLWEIRARRFVHDIAAQQLYFMGAEVRIAGIPLAYLPRLRLPDPTLKRAAGFLVPKIEVTSTLGFGIKTPYFIPLGPHRDILVTPHVSASGTRSLDLRYRQAFSAGNVTVNGALSVDDQNSSILRGYVLANGDFDLPRGYKLTLQAETVSDADYFRQYGLTEQDRFVTSLQVERANRDVYTRGRILGFYSVRSNDVNTTQPSQIVDFDRVQRLDLGQWGTGSFAIITKARHRASVNPADGPDSDTAADGRDVAGFGLHGEWQKAGVLPFGILARAALALRFDSYLVAQDSVYAGKYDRWNSAFATELRWPLIRTSANGAVQTLEPIAQLVMAPRTSQRLFNEDSALVEFDEGNLFALNRFPGSDQIETGSRANLGLNYTYAAPGGRRLQLSFGRVVSAHSAAQFAAASGLGQMRSDWLLAGQFDANNGFGLTVRSLLTNRGDIRKLELRGAVQQKNSGISLGYLFTPADAQEDRSTDISEISLFATQNLSARWNGALNSRYDAQTGQFSKAGLALAFRNECLQMDVALSRSFTSSATLQSNTTFGMSVALLGFGGQAAGTAQQCRK